MKHDVCALAELDDGRLVEAEAGGVKLLLSRDGDAVNAVGASCPHKGAALKDGVRVGNRVICPWHHAMFDLASGDHLEPPGHKCLARFAASAENGRVTVEVPEGVGEHRPEVEPDARRRGGDAVFLIVGAGAAGFACAEELAKGGFDGRIVLISPEAEPPYDRTDLSKTYLNGKWPDDKLPMASPGELEALGIETVVGVVERVDADRREVRFADGRTMGFAKCFVAPGSDAARLKLPNADLPNVLTLRSHADGRRVKAAVDAANHVVVIGAGFIGLEAASQLAGMGKRVSVVAKDRLPFARQFGEAVAGQIARRHADEGVALHCRAEVESLKAEGGRVVAVKLKSGQEIETDLVLVSIGAAPRTELVDPDAGKGLEVDALLAFRPDVHLGGDIAAVPVPGQPKPLRIEHWRVAEQHGRQAARAMLGQAEPFRSVPFFWSGQYDRISYVGHATSTDEVHIAGDLDGGSYTAFYVERGRVTAALGRGEDDRTPALHAVMLADPTPARERLESVGWDPARLIDR
ncbi:FAD-dependent oxidoreductase [Aureimonas leprariae]|uniref:Rieske 2Fe-2S domain-containing protein n=1 Tax=Plantimonas leprariae TaxID=2615207 RepID=A0A7V7PKX7_9HYPH|nr:FAD-dependent oxidoreductase [Aureimonas leprariae]KAB0676551.1 Rieske 2Fe-2S domain-containing protein [Aureimonas leprariae]